MAVAHIVLSAPSPVKNKEDPWAGVLTNAQSTHESSHRLVEKTQIILSSPRYNIRTPPSQRVVEHNELKAFRNATREIRSDAIGQTAADTRSHLKSFGPVNNKADAVSAISLAKINALFAEKYADKKDDSRKFTNYTSDPYTPWGSTAEYTVDLILSSPLFVFIENRLHMTVELQKGSKVTAKLTNGTEMVKDIVPGTPAVTSAPLTRVTGSSDDYSVALNINQTEWIVKLDIGKETVDPTFEGHVQKGLQSYFTSTFHDSDYILGTMILNPDQPGIIKGLDPKEFIMRTVEDAYGRSGNGFLVLMIQTDGAPLTDATPNNLPTKFNLVPDEYDAALYITNRALYNSIYLESFSPVVSGLTPVNVDGALTYNSGTMELGNLEQREECKNGMDGCNCKWVNHRIQSTSFSAYHSDDENPQRLAFQASTPSITFRDADIKVLPGQRYLTCVPLTTEAEFFNRLSFDFTLNKDIIEIEFGFDFKFEGDFSSPYWWEGQRKSKLDKLANEWGHRSAELIRSNAPKIQSLNTFRLNRIMFPKKNIYSYKEVHALADLVLFGNSVSK
eukprot:Nk52_evm2s2485 gene=Nk52_evmTU2s2485